MTGSAEKGRVATVMLGTILLGLLAVVTLSAGQTLLKVGLNQIGGFSLAGGAAGWLKLLRTPWILIGLGCYILSSVLWLDVLSKLDFSLAFPLMGSTYAFTLMIGYFFFREAIGWDRLLGVGLILCGVLFLARSARLPR